MSTELTGTPTYRATITVPVDGDTRNAASVQAGFQDCADSLAAHDGVLKGTTPWPTFSSIQIQPGTFGSGSAGQLNVNATNTYFAGTVHFDGGLYGSGVKTRFNSGATYDNGSYSFYGTGKPVYRVGALPDAAATLNISVADVWVMSPATLTANRIYTLGATGAEAGCRLTLSRWQDLNASWDCQIKNSAASLLITLTASVYAAEFLHNGTDWIVIGRYT